MAEENPRPGVTLKTGFGITTEVPSGEPLGDGVEATPHLRFVRREEAATGRSLRILQQKVRVWVAGSPFLKPREEWRDVPEVSDVTGYGESQWVNPPVQTDQPDDGAFRGMGGASAAWRGTGPERDGASLRAAVHPGADVSAESLEQVEIETNAVSPSVDLATLQRVMGALDLNQHMPGARRAELRREFNAAHARLTAWESGIWEERARGSMEGDALGQLWASPLGLRLAAWAKTQRLDALGPRAIVEVFLQRALNFYDGKGQLVMGPEWKVVCDPSLPEHAIEFYSADGVLLAKGTLGPDQPAIPDGACEVHLHPVEYGDLQRTALEMNPAFVHPLN